MELFRYSNDKRTIVAGLFQDNILCFGMAKSPETIKQLTVESIDNNGWNREGNIVNGRVRVRKVNVSPDKKLLRKIAIGRARKKPIAVIAHTPDKIGEYFVAQANRLLSGLPIEVESLVGAV